MQATKQLLSNILQDKTTTDAVKAQMLRYIFSFPINIGLFGQFFYPEAITDQSPPFHEELIQELIRPENTADAAPRGHAKSTITGLVYLTWNVCNAIWKLGSHQDKYVVYISQNHRKTIQFLDPVRHEFKNNALLSWAYGPFVVGKTQDENGKDREDIIDVNGIRIEAVSFEKNLRGFKHKHSRPTLIICDDIEDDQRVLNPELRIKDENKLNKIIIPSLDPKGRLKFIGTLLHVDSLLAKKIKQYQGKTWEACDAEFKNILWPERYPEKKLREIARDIGTIPFQSEYRNNPTDTTKSIIKREWVQSCLREDISMEELAVRVDYTTRILGVDFAFEDRVTSDWSTFGGVGIKDGYFHLIHAEWQKGWSVSEQFQHIKDSLHTRFRFNHVSVEENSIKAVTKDLRKYNLPLKFFWMGSTDTAAKNPTSKDYEYVQKRHTISKNNLAFRLATSFENKRWIIPYKTDKDKETANRLMAELTSWALADGKLVEAGIHPDMPISLGLVVETNMVRPGFSI